MSETSCTGRHRAPPPRPARRSATLPAPGAALWLGALAACSSAPPPPQPPVVAARIDWHPAPLSAGRPATLRVRWLPAPPAPAGGLPLAATTRLVIRPQEGEPLGGIPTIHPGLRVLAGAAAAEWLAAAADAAEAPPPAESAAVVAGAATAVRLHLALPGSAAAERTVEWQVVLQEPGVASCSLFQRRGEAVQEVAVLQDALRSGGAPLGFHVPFGAGLAVFLELLEEPPSAGQQDAAQRALGQAEERLAATAAAAAPEAAAQGFVHAQVQAFVHGVGARQRRPALLALCERTGAPRCADLALIADDVALIDIAREIPVDFGLRPLPEQALTLETAAFAAVAPRLLSLDLPPAMLAWIRRHAGAAGDSAIVLERVLADCPSTAVLEQRLVAANLGALENSHPEQRVAAFDWLVDRGLDLASYEPLAGPAERRRAIAALRARRAAAGVEGGGGRDGSDR